MTDELTDLEQTKKAKKAERARERRWIAGTFVEKLLDTLWAFGIVFVGFVLFAIVVGALGGGIVLIIQAHNNYGPVGAILTFIGEIAIAIIVIAIVRTILDAIDQR